jgi:hypothetical protein
MTHDIAAMEKQLQNIQKSLAVLTGSNYPEELMLIVRRPGFTTVAEAMLIHTMLDHMRSQIEQLRRSCDGLPAAAREIAQ